MRRKIDFDAVRKMALALADAEESTSSGVFSVKVRGKLFTWQAVNKSVEPGTLAVRMDLDRREELLETDPETYYITDHYIDYPVVLVRLARVRPEALKDLLLMGWRFVTTKTPKGRR